MSRSSESPRPNAWLGHALLSVAAVGLLVWSYADAFREMESRWSSDPQYSHGYLVPLFAAGLLWLRRGQVRSWSFQPSVWGLPVLAAASPYPGAP